MKERFDVVEKDGRFHLYEGGQEYLTPCFFPISSCDKGLVEAIARKLGEGKPNLVMLYLRKYDNAELFFSTAPKAIAFEGKTNGREKIVEMGLSNELVAERLIEIYGQIITKNR